MSAVVPLLLASQNGNSHISPTFALIVALIATTLVFYLSFATIYYGFKNKRENERLTQATVKKYKNKAWLSVKLAVLYHHQVSSNACSVNMTVWFKVKNFKEEGSTPFSSTILDVIVVVLLL